MFETNSSYFGLTEKQFHLIVNAIHGFDEIEKVLIFGSRATGKNNSASDIDLAVFGNHLNQTIINRLTEKLDDLPLPFMFDVVDYNKLKNASLKEKIERQGKLFSEKQLNT